MKNVMITILSNIYDGNPISYQMLRNLNRAIGWERLVKGLICLLILPCIPIWNRMANKEINNIRNNEHIYPIRNGRVKFFLPDLDLLHGEFIQNRIFLERDYFEVFHLARLKKYMKTNAVILDIGANIGNHTIYFAKECMANKIYAFEPTPKTFQILKKNIRINQLDDTVVAMNVALGAKESKVNVVVDMKDAGSNYVEESTDGNICMNTLDDLSLDSGIDLIKIDVEGYEYEVLKGAKRTIVEDKPDIFIEIFDANYDRVHGFLTQMGYRCELEMEQDYLFIYEQK